MKIFLFLLPFIFSIPQGEAMNLDYCTDSTKITFNPFEGYNHDYDRLSYLKTSLRPYISSSNPEIGILSRWSWSPDGRVLTAIVSKNATWQDGSRAHSRDIAYSIAMGMKFRYFGDKIRIKGFDADIRDESWHKKEYEGIQIVDSDKFVLHFESEINLLAATIEESLSEKATYNFTWPKRLDSKEFDVISYHKISKENETYSILYKKHKLTLVDRSQCDFSRKTIALNVRIDEQNHKNYSVIKSKVHVVNTGVVNTNKAIWKDPLNRSALIAFVRSGSKNYMFPTAVKADTIIIEGEPGYSKVKPWPNSTPKALPFSRIKIATSFPVKKDNGLVLAINKKAKEVGVEIDWSVLTKENEEIDKNIDILIMGGKSINGRQVWLQDSFYRPAIKLLGNDKDMLKICKDLLRMSVSTIPVSVGKIVEFEQTARESYSIFPVIRLAYSSFNSNDSSVRIAFTRDSTPILQEVNH